MSKVRFSEVVARAPSYFEMHYLEVKDTNGKSSYGKTVKVLVADSNWPGVLDMLAKWEYF